MKLTGRKSSNIKTFDNQAYARQKFDTSSTAILDSVVQGRQIQDSVRGYSGPHPDRAVAKTSNDPTYRKKK